MVSSDENASNGVISTLAVSNVGNEPSDLAAAMEKSNDENADNKPSDLAETSVDSNDNDTSKAIDSSPTIVSYEDLRGKPFEYRWVDSSKKNVKVLYSISEKQRYKKNKRKNARLKWCVAYGVVWHAVIYAITVSASTPKITMATHMTQRLKTWLMCTNSSKRSKLSVPNWKQSVENFRHCKRYMRRNRTSEYYFPMNTTIVCLFKEL